MSEPPEVWTASHPMTGEWLIECDGWAFATLHYDYRYTSNAQMHYRAELITSAPQLKADNARLRAALAEAEKARDEYLRMARLHGDGLIATQGRLAAAERERDEAKSMEADLAAARDVLKPFAAIANICDAARKKFSPSSPPSDEGSAHVSIEICNRARAFLERTATAAAATEDK